MNSVLWLLYIASLFDWHKIKPSLFQIQVLDKQTLSTKVDFKQYN